MYKANHCMQFQFILAFSVIGLKIDHREYQDYNVAAVRLAHFLFLKIVRN